MAGALKVRTSTDPDVWETLGGGSFATAAEVVAGTNDTKAITPAGLKAAQLYVDVRQFGAKGDGTTDDTVALQAWADYITTNHHTGWLPNGTYKITAPITFKTVTGWGVIGEDRSHTVVKQFTSNVPVFKFGDVLGSPIFHSIVFRCVHLTYNTPQPAANTAANALELYTMMYYSELTMLQFTNCAWGIHATGVSNEYSPWGCTWDDLVFGTLGIGAINIGDGGGATPNNIFGRMTINCTGAVGPVLDMQGYNTTFQAIEFLYADSNAVLFRLASGGQIWIGAIKIEIASYTGVGVRVFDFFGGSQVQIGSVFIGGTTAVFTPTTSGFSLFNIGSGGGNGAISVGHVRVAATTLTAGIVNLVSCPVTCKAVFDDVDLQNGWTLQYTGGSASSDNVWVNSWMNGSVSDNLGDADKVVALRDPNTLMFNTAFTAPRTVTLPAKAGNNLFAGLTYKIIANGAINGANTLIIKEGTNTLRTQTVDKVVIEYTWKRISGGQWIMTGYQLLP